MPAELRQWLRESRTTLGLFRSLLGFWSQTSEPSSARKRTSAAATRSCARGTMIQNKLKLTHYPFHSQLAPATQVTTAPSKYQTNTLHSKRDVVGSCYRTPPSHPRPRPPQQPCRRDRCDPPRFQDLDRTSPTRDHFRPAPKRNNPALRGGVDRRFSPVCFTSRSARHTPC